MTRTGNSDVVTIILTQGQQGLVVCPRIEVNTYDVNRMASMERISGLFNFTHYYKIRYPDITFG